MSTNINGCPKKLRPMTIQRFDKKASQLVFGRNKLNIFSKFIIFNRVNTSNSH